MSIPRLQDYPLPVPETLPENRISWQLEPKRCALLIHDMQNYFLNFWDELSPMIRQVIANLVALRERCHQLGIPVFYTAQPNHQQPEDRALLNDMWGPRLNRHPEQQQFVEPLAPAEQDTVLVKWRYSAFQRSDLESRLRELKRDQLIIGGVYAHIGCLTTATDAFMRDIQPFMVADALADFSQQEHEMALRYTAGRSGRVLSTEAALAELKASDDRAWNKEKLLALLANALDEDTEALADDDNLLDYGLDSVRIMSLASHWRKEGHELDFVALVKQPTLKAWLTLLNARQEA
ncbi:putative isochorismatase of enterobactin synthase multienzyme complex [Serratia symbiotica str. Tucson]|uniref:isochorismatase n=2 Tax=Serratia symbiotica TaxID=138074 RepID=E9CKC9_9GAMM|nr:isochorismatase family protein [Serratia symbiotica]EFW13041.1 putative isochorismatase of enterobactin synthase multienzyme complex [Serratia symbiotica str. Tucson]BBI92940.1 isochorismatase of enterobactin synthase multienzyme complex [Serratia symbiotica]